MPVVSLQRGIGHNGGATFIFSFRCLHIFGIFDRARLVAMKENYGDENQEDKYD